MVRNNLLALAFHVVIILIAWLFLPGFAGDIFWPPKEARPALALAPVALYLLMLYPSAGFLLRPQSSRLRNLLSVSAPGFLLVTLLLVDPYEPPYRGFASLWGEWVQVRSGGLTNHFLNAGSFYLFWPLLYAPSVTQTSQNVLAAFLSLPPTLLLWMGLQLRAWRDARKVSLGASR
jgi:hypothetical protein